MPTLPLLPNVVGWDVSRTTDGVRFEQHRTGRVIEIVSDRPFSGDTLLSLLRDADAQGLKWLAVVAE